MSKQTEQPQETPGPKKTPDSQVEGFQHPSQFEPRRLTPTQFSQYQSLELKKLDNTLGRFKRSLPYLGAILLTQLDVWPWDGSLQH